MGILSPLMFAQQGAQPCAGVDCRILRAHGGADEERGGERVGDRGQQLTLRRRERRVQGVEARAHRGQLDGGPRGP